MAIYEATNLTPRNSAIDVTEDNTFSCQVNGTTIDQYRLQIFPIAGGGAIIDIQNPISPPLGDKGILNIDVTAPNAMSNGNDYKYTIETFEGLNSVVSSEVAFFANTNPVVTLTVPPVITAQSYEFAPTYTQAEDVPVEFSYYEFRDNNGDLILRTEDNFTGNLNYTFNGFLSDTTYQVQFFGQAQNGVQFETALTSFAVSYAQPNINIKPTVIQDSCTSIINVSWGGVVVIPGVSTGTFSYISDHITVGNTALDLDAGSTITWTVNVPETFTRVTGWTKPVDYTTGDIVELLDGSNSYVVGYDGTQWYYNNKGALGYSDPIALSTNNLFIIMQATTAYIWDSTADTLTQIITN